MGEVRWTAEAARWLHEIHDYIAQDNPEAALRTVRGIHQLAESLVAFPTSTATSGSAEVPQTPLRGLAGELIAVGSKAFSGPVPG